MSAVPPVVDRPRPLHAVDTDAYFAPQPTSTARLPDPRPLVENLAHSVVEVLSGAREIEQIARWLNETVYQHLLKRVVLASRGRAARGASASRPVFQLGATRITSPADGVIEATVIMHGRARTRAIAIRLEGFDSRWRATALHVL
ncbi:Rv3235 family protein [uncultured Amnibacterium sp.]|uniref:Rv3235 family protein n=1 Tax=uncultured Amnibacterium sp. TaxID=1631851 RepID=UPI0035CA3EC6